MSAYAVKTQCLPPKSRAAVQGTDHFFSVVPRSETAKPGGRLEPAKRPPQKHCGRGVRPLEPVGLGPVTPKRVLEGGLRGEFGAHSPQPIKAVRRLGSNPAIAGTTFAHRPVRDPENGPTSEPNPKGPMLQQYLPLPQSFQILAIANRLFQHAPSPGVDSLPIYLG